MWNFTIKNNLLPPKNPNPRRPTHNPVPNLTPSNRYHRPPPRIDLKHLRHLRLPQHALRHRRRQLLPQLGPHVIDESINDTLIDNLHLFALGQAPHGVVDGGVEVYNMSLGDGGVMNVEFGDGTDGGAEDVREVETEDGTAWEVGSGFPSPLLDFD